MMKSRLALAVALVVGCGGGLLADVRADQKTRVEFAGMLGRMMNLFGGKAARDGVSSSVAVKGDRKATLNDTTGQIIDLAEEKVYDLDIKKKSYKVTTFAELRRRMEEAQKKAQEDAKKQEEKPQAAKDDKEIEIDFTVKNTGESRTINGFNTRQAITAITVREKGKTVEQGGGMILTSDMWLAPRIDAMREVADFDMRYAQKLYGSMVSGVSAEQMAAAMAMYPMLKQAMGKMAAEGSKLEGTPILTTATFDSVKSDDQMAEEIKQQTQQAESDKPSLSGGVGGLLGGFAKKAAAKKLTEEPKQRTTFMTTSHEVLKVSTEVAAADVAIPMGFKENK